MRYSAAFERDYEFYFRNRDNFSFSGTQNPKFVAIPLPDGKTAKEVFFLIESRGRNEPTCEPELLNQLLLCKGGVNFMIKQWAAGRADGTLTLGELIGYPPPTPTAQRLMAECGHEETEDTLSIKDQYGLPDWVIMAVEKQKEKMRKDLDIRKRPAYLYSHSNRN